MGKSCDAAHRLSGPRPEAQSQALQLLIFTSGFLDFHFRLMKPLLQGAVRVPLSSGHRHQTIIPLLTHFPLQPVLGDGKADAEN